MSKKREGQEVTRSKRAMYTTPQYGEAKKVEQKRYSLPRIRRETATVSLKERERRERRRERGQ